jgi:hypothetical protein
MKKMKNSPLNLKLIFNKISHPLSLIYSNLVIDEKKCELYQSKKHLVFKINIQYRKNHSDSAKFTKKNLVVKVFNKNIQDWEEKWKRETDNYTFLKEHFETMIPRRIVVLNDLIVYEKLDGENLQFLYLQGKLEQDIIRKLSKFYADLHHLNKIFGDSRLSNFILDSNNLFVVDYEDITIGNAENDFSNLLSSFIDLNPGIFSDNIQEYQKKSIYACLCHYLQEKHLIEQKNRDRYILEDKIIHFWTNSILDALKITAVRRKIKISSENLNTYKLIIRNVLINLDQYDLKRKE